MADYAGQADIRGLFIEKETQKYFEEALIFKNLVTTKSTPSRTIRWYQKTSGYLTATSPAKISPVAEGARPFVLQQSWTRNTSYVKKYMVDSPMIKMEDETDSDVAVFQDNLRDDLDAVAYDLDSDIWDVATEGQIAVNINSVTADNEWDDYTNATPIEDIEEAKQEIREQTKRTIRNGVLLVNAQGAKDLIVYLIQTKGSSIPNFASEKVSSGVLGKLLDLTIVVSENVTSDYALVGDLSQAVEYREFIPITTAIIKEEGIGRKIRCWTHGIALLVKPKYLTLLDNLVTP
jgi:hypothetical protein